VNIVEIQMTKKMRKRMPLVKKLLNEGKTGVEINKAIDKKFGAEMAPTLLYKIINGLKNGGVRVIETNGRGVPLDPQPPYNQDVGDEPVESKPAKPALKMKLKAALAATEAKSESVSTARSMFTAKKVARPVITIQYLEAIEAEAKRTGKVYGISPEGIQITPYVPRPTLSE
jgi:selenocysteine-specific translation elongation factor